MIRKSPAQLFFNRRLKTDLPTASPLLESNSVGMQDIQERLKTRKYQQKINYDAHAGKELRDLYPGESTVMCHEKKMDSCCNSTTTQFSKVIHSPNTVCKAIQTAHQLLPPSQINLKLMTLLFLFRRRKLIHHAGRILSILGLRNPHRKLNRPIFQIQFPVPLVPDLGGVWCVHPNSRIL